MVAGRFREHVVLITGASSGIGAGMAREFAREGAKVALLSRRAAMNDSVAQGIIGSGGEALAITADVCARAQLDAAVEQIVTRWGRLDVVVANAGFGVSGPFQKLSTEDFRRQFETNVFGLLDTVYAALPHIVSARGRVVLLGSTMGRMGLPTSAPYCASKYAVNGVADCAVYDLAGLGVSLTVVNPGLVESEIRSKNNQGVLTEHPDPAPQWLVMPLEKASRQIVRAVHRRRFEFIVTRHGRFGVWLNRHFPWIVRTLILRLSKNKIDRIDRKKKPSNA